MKMTAMRDVIDNIEHRLHPFVPVKITSGVDRYGFSSVLAKRCGRRIGLRSFANWVHGWVWHDKPTDKLLGCAGLPHDVTIIACNEVEKLALVDASFRDVRLGGLPFAYIPRQHTSRFADSLLAFLPHSFESGKVTFDQDNYLDYLESLSPDFEAIYISIYHLDMGGAMHKAALARGLRVIQGARPDDANSLLRMRSILDSFTFVTSNCMGSHMLYALFAGCRFSFCGPFYGYDESFFLRNGNPDVLSTDLSRQFVELQSEPYIRERFGRFFVNHPRMGVQDVKFAEEEIGMRFVMSPEQIEDALGWSVLGQVKGCLSGARRRLLRAAHSFKR